MQRRLFSTNNKRTFYEILQVKNTSNFKEIKSKYYKLCKLFHPDTKSKESTNNSKEFQEILTAFETLKDPKKRKEYDRSLALTNYYKAESKTSLKDFEFKPKPFDSQDGTIKFWSKMNQMRQEQKRREEIEKEEQSKNERIEDMKVFRDRVLIISAVIFGYYLSTTFRI